VEGAKDEDSLAPISEEVAISGNSSTSETHSTSSEAETVRHEGDRRSAIESSSVEVDGDSSSSSSSGISSCGSQRSLRGIMAPPKFVPLGTPSLHTEER
jgi:hypothetical protein